MYRGKRDQKVDFTAEIAKHSDERNDFTAEDT
jgi:hypothetical protein